MKLLNLCAGANRDQSECWYNLDQLHPVLSVGTPERQQLDSEVRYTEHDVLAEPLPYPPDHFDAVLASHCVEHWDIHEATRVMGECRRVLKPNGLLLVSVPDASYFRLVHSQDTVENAVRVFGEPIHLPDGEITFLGYGLFNRFHKALLTVDSLWCYFIRAGFKDGHIRHLKNWELQEDSNNPSLEAMKPLLNRLPFSLLIVGIKG